MATIKEILDQFCYRLNIPAQSSYVGNTAPAARQYVSLFQFIGDTLRNHPNDWPQLKRSYTFTTVTDQRVYQLPGDFYRILPSTQWDITNQQPMRGSISDYEFAIRQYGISAADIRKAYRLIGPVNHLISTSPYAQRSAGTIQIDPAGANNTDQLVMNYVSCNWVWPRDWVTLTAYSLGDIRAGNGYVYRVTTAGTSGATRPSVATGTETDGTVTWRVYTEPYPVLPTNTNLNDSDLCLFDDDLMIEGMRWAWFRSKKQEYETERLDWENMINGAFGRFNGPVRVNMCDEMTDREEWPNVADGSWSV